MGSMIDAQDLRELLPSVLDAPPSPLPPPDTRLAAVLVPVLVAAPEPRLIFTRRQDNLSRHPGEISFPGGLADEGEDPRVAALREVKEELGIAPHHVDLVGALPAVHTRVTGILIVPFVGLLEQDPALTPNAAEIAEVLEFPLRQLVERGAEVDWEWQGTRFPTFAYDMDGQVIWGATARILQSFVEALDRVRAEEG